MYCSSSYTSDLAGKEQQLIECHRYVQVVFDASFKLLVESNN